MRKYNNSNSKINVTLIKGTVIKRAIIKAIIKN